MTEAAWLQPDIVEGYSAGEADTVTLTADASALLHGIYSTTLSVSGPHASDNPRTIKLTLYAYKTLRVPSEYGTIQAAIDATVPGDEVIVGDAVYTGVGNKDLDFRGKPITVRSASGHPTACIIDCQGSGRGFYFHSGETPGAVAAGFTIRNGTGSAVYCVSSSPTLTNCTITGGSASYGAGVNCYSSSPQLTNCLISGNRASNGLGGGVYCSNWSSPTLTNCTISGNTITDNGGGGLALAIAGRRAAIDPPA